MCEVKKCCCCVDLRVGAITFAILEVAIAITAFYFVKGANYPGMMIASALVGLAAGLCLLFGSIQYNATATAVYLVLQMISIVFFGIQIILSVVTSGMLNRRKQPIFGNAIFVGFLVLAFTLSIYFWVCIFSLYRGLRRGEISSPA